MVRKHYFKAYFVEKQAKKKISIFDQSHGLTPLKNISIGRPGKILIFSLGRLVLETDRQETLFQSLFCLKGSKEKNSNC